MRNWWKYLLLALMVLVAAETMSFVAARVLLKQNLLVQAPDTQGYDDYLRDRDAVVGWPGPGSIGSGEYDASGSRVVPNFPDTRQRSCVALFGDSFTWGDEVPAEAAYGNVLSKRLECRVANYGVGGYGTDQAFLRYSYRIQDDAPVVILGHFAENIVRNVNQLRDLLSGGRFGFKPRFTIGPTGELHYVPLPQLSAADYAIAHEETSRLLPHEFFVPNTAAGPALMRAPYTIAAVRALGHFRMRARLSGVPSYAPFYDPAHPSGALAVTFAILREFQSVAESRGQQPVIIIIPDERNLRQLRTDGTVPYEPLLTELRRAGIDTPDIAGLLLEHLGGRDSCEIYISCSGNSHFNEEGYAQLATIVHAWLVENELVGL